MAPTPKKGRKSISLWTTCTNCQSVYEQKDNEIHATECNLDSTWSWKHNFIRNKVFYSNIESCNLSDFPGEISENEAINMVSMSTRIMQMCNISIGDPVILCFKHISIVKLAWPSCNENLTRILLLKSAIELDQLVGSLKIQKLTDPVYIANEISLKYNAEYNLPSWREFTMFLKAFNEHKIITMSNKIKCIYNGKFYCFHIENIQTNDICQNSSQLEQLGMSTDEMNTTLFYKIDSITNFKVNNDNYFKPQFKYTLNDIGGYENIIKDIQNVINTSINAFNTKYNSFYYKGILLSGSSGVGKTMIAEAIMNTSVNNVIIVNFFKLYNKAFTEIELDLRIKFKEAKMSSPSIIYIKNIDILFLDSQKSENDHGRKIMYILMNLFDEIDNLPVIVLATTSHINTIDRLLKRPGKFDKVFDITSPNQNTRKKIIEKMLQHEDCDLSDEDLTKLAFETHGYVSADLKRLYDKVIDDICNFNDTSRKEKIRITLQHFRNALKIIKPSAMEGISVEVSSVKWEDIGGQKLKKELKKIVELSLYHPEIFEKVGLPPPRGVLMYGPPGCSKTMIAKAWANESKLNFINIQASDIFSKWVGDSEKAVREVFKKARQVAPSIIFIDEIDAIGGQRGASSNETGTNVETRVLTHILTELDGISSIGSVLLVAATNRPDRIDSALLRPGRFDNIIYVPLPDAETREEIFNIKLKKMPLDKNINRKSLVDRTDGYSGAEVEAVCVKAYMNAITNDLHVNNVTMDNFNEALSIVKPMTPNYLIQIYNKFKVKCHS